MKLVLSPVSYVGWPISGVEKGAFSMKIIIFKSALVEYSIGINEFSIAIFLIILYHSLISGIILIFLNHKCALTIVLNT